VGDARVIAVFAVAPRSETTTICLSVLDLTGCPCQTLGGYSIVVLEARKDGRFKAEGQRALIAPLAKFEELAAV